MVNNIKESHMNQINELIDEGVNPISIISQEFNDIDLEREFKDNYTITVLDKTMTWNKFLKWFHSIANIVPFFSKFRKRVIIISTDMLSRIPKDKTPKDRAKITSVHKFIQYINISVKVPVILVSEKPIKDYRMKVKPLIIGNIIDYTNTKYIVEQILYEPDVDKTIYVLSKYGNFYDPLMSILQYNLYRYAKNFSEFDKFIKIYFKIRFEAKLHNVRLLLASSFKLKTRRSVIYPPEYFKTFKYMKTTSKLVKSL